MVLNMHLPREFMSKTPRSLAVESTIFWLVVSAILIVASSDLTMITEAASGVVTAVVYLVVAYLCWNQRKWSFVGAIALALFVTVGGVAFPILAGLTNSVFGALSSGAIILVPQFLLIFFSYRAYREG